MMSNSNETNRLFLGQNVSRASVHRNADMREPREVQSADQGLTLFQTVNRLSFTRTLEQDR